MGCGEPTREEKTTRPRLGHGYLRLLAQRLVAAPSRLRSPPYGHMVISSRFGIWVCS
jgi:hypothetical protein